MIDYLRSMWGAMYVGVQRINWVWGYDVTPRVEHQIESEMEARIRSGNARHPARPTYTVQ